MGRKIEAKHADLNHRIFKNHGRYSKFKKFLRKTESERKTLKRNVCENDSAEPPAKVKKNAEDAYCDEAYSFLKRYKSEEVVDDFAVEYTNTLQLRFKGDNSLDLFFEDEVKNSYLVYAFKDLQCCIVEEIAFEGLDGITLEALWKRLWITLEHPVMINEGLKITLWEMIRDNEGFQFFALPEPRGSLDIHNRFNYYDSEGVVIEMPTELPDLYPLKVVNAIGVRGSCSTFQARSDVSQIVRTMTLMEATQTYGTRLVIVAGQPIRNALLLADTDPLLEMQNLEYCILERIGRSRKLGETTQGNMSITSAFKLDPKSMFHYQKHLVQNGVITKQFFYIRSAISEQNKTGRLVHLQRFYKKYKSKQLLIAQQIISLLKKQPENRIPFSDIKKFFPEYQPVLKVMKSGDFRRFVKMDCIYLYRAIYPAAKKFEYLKRNSNRERTVRCLELMNPYINILAVWNSNDDSDSEDEDDEGETSGTKAFNVELFREVYFLIFSKGKQGCSEDEIRKTIAVDRNMLRMALKKLLAKNVIHIRRFESGKQRQLLYYAKCLDNDTVICNEFGGVPEEKEGTISKAKARIIEKQRAAIEKQKGLSTASRTPQTDSQETHLGISKTIELRRNRLRDVVCEYVVNRMRTVIESTNGVPDLRFEFSKSFNIPLTYTKSMRTRLDINQTLNLCKPTRTDPSWSVVNFDNVYVERRGVNKIIKLILLKAMFREVAITDFASFVDCKRARSGETSVAQEIKKIKQLPDDRFEDKLQLLGDNPRVVFEKREQNLDICVICSTSPVVVNYGTRYPPNEELPDRAMFRYQLILDIVNKEKVFEDFSKLQRLITNEEAKSGYNRKIDRKSLARILRRLSGEGYLKMFKLFLTDTKIKKQMIFICHPTASHDDSVIDAACQQFKWKYFVTQPSAKAAQLNVTKDCGKEAELSPFKEHDVLESIELLKEIKNFSGAKPSIKQLRTIGRRHGLRPKFIRMRIIHEFLFYLVYDYGTPRKPLTDSEVRNLFRSYLIDLSEEDVKNMPGIFCEELSWKMFIPPLPHHKGWPKGWALMCDVILRLPVSVLCKIHGCSYKLPELEDILNHPIKRYYLLKDLPQNVRTVIMHKRKYLFNIYESLNRVAFCGLLQFGPQKYKEKDQSFIYLNRNASLLDTTTSEPSYHKVTDKDYKRIGFRFNSQSDLDNYWYQVHMISLNTKLNQKTTGQTITMIDISARPELNAALRSRTPEEAAENDNGHIYGDKRGAAGLDSSLWTHIVKNWFWPTLRPKANEKPALLVGLKKDRVEKVLPRNVSFANLHLDTSNKVYLHKAPPKVATAAKTKKLAKSHAVVPARTSKRFQKLVRKVAPRAKKRRPRQYHDALDNLIIKRNGVGNRVRWSQAEDNHLLLCKAVDLFLNPAGSKKKIVFYTVIRDVLHRMIPDSANKTSRACQRRIKKLLTNSNLPLEENVFDLLKIDEISTCFAPWLHKMLHEKSDPTSKLAEGQVNIAFVILMSYVFEHKKDVMQILQGVRPYTSYLCKMNLDYVENNLLELEEGSLKFRDAADENDVKKDVLKAVIHSSLTSKNQPDWALHVFKIYQKYPDHLTRSAIEELKMSQTISSEKFAGKRNRNHWHIPFKLSQCYINYQFTTFSTTTALQSYNTFLELLEDLCRDMDFSQEMIESKKYGQLLGINEFFTFRDDVRFEFYIPQNTVILNPDIEDHSALVDELAARYQIRLRNMLQDNTTETEQDQDNRDNDESFRYIPSESELMPSNKSNKLSRSTESHSDHQDTNYFQVDDGNPDTINLLRTWVTDCMQESKERSPSPEFMNIKEECLESVNAGFIETDEWNAGVQKFSTQDQIPTLDEIKQGMLKVFLPNEERSIPYITDLGDLLNELNTDEETLEKLKSHFITQYAHLDSVIVNELDELRRHYLVEYLQDKMRNTHVWEKVQKDIYVNTALSMREVLEKLREEGGTDDDSLLLTEMVEFICAKEVLGVTGPEVTEKFLNNEKNLALETILQVLIEAQVVLRVGICKIAFVHYKYRSSWLVETFDHIATDKRANQPDKKEPALPNDKKLINVKVAPWTKINGKLNEDVFKIWLCNVLSHCIDYPEISFPKLCEKFCYVKPVDVFYLLEVLQELGCLELVQYEDTIQTVYSEWEPPKKKYTALLDDLEFLVVEPNNLSMLCLGSFFHNVYIDC